MDEQNGRVAFHGIAADIEAETYAVYEYCHGIAAHREMLKKIAEESRQTGANQAPS